MKVRIIADPEYFHPQHKTWLGWESIRLHGNRLFETEKQAWEAVSAKLYPDGKVLYEGEL